MGTYFEQRKPAGAYISKVLNSSRSRSEVESNTTM